MTYNNFLHEYRPYTFNNGDLVSLHSEQARHLINTHAQEGFILVPTSSEQIAGMIDVIKDTCFSYLPLYQRSETQLDAELNEYDYQRYLMIFNFNSGYNIHQVGTTQDLTMLFDLALELTLQFGYDSFLFQAPEHSLLRFDNNGNPIDLKAMFPFLQCYINPSPACYSERVVRAGTKEIFLSR